MKSPITKTVKYTFSDFYMNTDMIGYCYMPKEGDEVILISHTDEMTGIETWAVHPYNANSQTREKVHGWCGTYNNHRTDAHGVRRVLNVSETTRDRKGICDTYHETIFSFKVGKDLYPEIA